MRTRRADHGRQESVERKVKLARQATFSTLLTLCFCLLSTGCDSSLECAIDGLKRGTDLRPSSSVFEGTVGEPFEVEIEAKGDDDFSRGGSEQFLPGEEPLPPGLAGGPRFFRLGGQGRLSWVISGIPTEAGRYPYRLNFERGDPRDDGDDCLDLTADGVYEFVISP